jgi:hypothetical protein
LEANVREEYTPPLVVEHAPLTDVTGVTADDA